MPLSKRTSTVADSSPADRETFMLAPRPPENASTACSGFSLARDDGRDIPARTAVVPWRVTRWTT